MNNTKLYRRDEVTLRFSFKCLGSLLMQILSSCCRDCSFVLAPLPAGTRYI